MTAMILSRALEVMLAFKHYKSITTIILSAIIIACAMVTSAALDGTAAEIFVTSYAGNGLFGDPKLLKPVVDTRLTRPLRITFDTTGSLFILDAHWRIFRVDANGTIFHHAGIKNNANYFNVDEKKGCMFGRRELGEDGSDAIDATFCRPTDIAVDNSGNVYISELGFQRVRVINTNGKIFTMAGGGNYSDHEDDYGDFPVDNFYYAGGYYFSDSSMHGADTGDETILAVKASLSDPMALASFMGNIYIADSGNARIRVVNNTSGNMTTIAGGGNLDISSNLLARSVNITSVDSLSIDNLGNIYFTNGESIIWRISYSTGLLTSIVGHNKVDYLESANCLAADAITEKPNRVMASGDGKFVYFIDFDQSRFDANTYDRIYRVYSINTRTGVVSRIPGNGKWEIKSGVYYHFSRGILMDIALDFNGNVYVSDGQRNRVWRASLYSGGVGVPNKRGNLYDFYAENVVKHKFL